MKEIFKDIEGYENLYQISNLVNVKSLGNGKSNNSKERILKPFKDVKLRMDILGNTLINHYYLLHPRPQYALFYLR